MHENRETSSLTAESQGSPAGKGQGRNASAHGGEESDRVEVPMKQTNKATEQQAETAEFAEGRTRTKENIGQDHTARGRRVPGIAECASSSDSI